jgi:hypothetical protein
MQDFIIDDRYSDGVVLTLHPSIRLPRVIIPVIVGCFTTAVVVLIEPSVMQSLAQITDSGSRMNACLHVIVCACFGFAALLSFLQAAVAAFGNQAWQATEDRLEFRQELLGWRIRKRITGQVILLSKPPSTQSTSWKLIVTGVGGGDHFWKHRHIHISSDDDELREVGKILAGSTGWQFVDEGVS